MRHLLEEFYEAKREKMVEDEIQRLMSDGGEFYPFSPKNLEEALGNFSKITYIMLSSYAHTANKLADNTYAHNWMSDIFLKEIKNYWLPIATETAEKNVPSAHELHQQELEFQHDTSRHNSA